MTLFGCGCDATTATTDFADQLKMPKATKDEQCAAGKKLLELYEKYDGCEANGVTADYTALITTTKKAQTDLGC